MRVTSLSGLLAGTLALAPLGIAVPAHAQSNPSASQIIKSLTPSGNLTNGNTRGIRLANPQAAPNVPPEAPSPVQAPRAGTESAGTESAAPPPRAATERAAVTAPHAPSVNLNVDFETGSAQLTPSARATLDQLGQALSSQQLAAYRFRIVGHTDTVGSARLNKQLSEQRAEAVAAYLEQHYGVTTARLQASGVGEQGLLVPTPPQTANARNRRVEVINLGA